MFILYYRKHKHFRRNHWKSIVTLDNSLSVVCFILLQLFAYIFLLKQKFRKIWLSFMKHCDVMWFQQHFCLAPEHHILFAENLRRMWDLLCSAFIIDFQLPLVPWKFNIAEILRDWRSGLVGFLLCTFFGGFCLVVVVFSPKNTDRKGQEIVCLNPFCYVSLWLPEIWVKFTWPSIT